MVRVRVCRAADVDALERCIPSPGVNRFHEARFRRQELGVSTFLVAFLDDVPVGSGEILWQGCGDDRVRQRFPGCPEFSGLIVWPAERRSRGVGTTLIRAAEARVRRRGHRWIGMGVDDTNPRAAALYLRLGYRDEECRYLDRYHYVDDNGVRKEAVDPCRFLVKELFLS
nr:GNAT family N-acetyltransferase [uncultured Actinoplanes sp.]